MWPSEHFTSSLRTVFAGAEILPITFFVCSVLSVRRESADLKLFDFNTPSVVLEVCVCVKLLWNFFDVCYHPNGS